MVREILEQATAFLQMDELYEELLAGNVSTAGGRPVIEGKSHLDGAARQLLTCANLVMSEAAAYYFPLRAVQRVVVSGEMIEFSAFENRVIDVIRVTAVSGAPARFERRATRIELPDGEYTVEYTYLPLRLGLEDPLPFGHKIGARILALGTACEYCIVNSMLEEAAMWDKRYRDAITAAAQPKSEARLARRRWV